MQPTSSSTKAPPLVGEVIVDGIEISYEISIKLQALQESVAKLLFNGDTLKFPVHFQFPVLSKRELLSKLNEEEPPFEVMVEKTSSHPLQFKVYLHSSELQNQTDEYAVFLNDHIFYKTTPSVLEYTVNLCFGPDRDERIKFYLDQLKKSSQEAQQNPRPINCVMLLDQAGHSLDGEELEKVKIRGAYVPGIIFRKAKLNGADLRDTAVENANFRKANVRGALLSGTEWGWLPLLKSKDLPVASAVSHDERFLAIGGHTVTLWSLENYTNGFLRQFPVQTFEFPAEFKGWMSGGLFSMDFSKNGRWIATASANGKILIWDLATGDIFGGVNYKPGYVAAKKVKFIFNDEYLFTEIPNELILWKIKQRPNQWEQVWKVEVFANSPAIAAYKNLVAISANNKVRLYRFDKGVMTQLKKWKFVYEKEEDERNAFSEVIHHIHFSSDGNTLFASGIAKIYVWNISEDEPQVFFESEENKIQCLFPLKNDSQLLFFVQPSNTFHLYDLYSKEELARFEISFVIQGIDVTPSGDKLILRDEQGNVHFKNLSNLTKQSDVFVNCFHSAGLANDEIQVITNDEMISFHLLTGRCQRRQQKVKFETRAELPEEDFFKGFFLPYLQEGTLKQKEPFFEMIYHILPEFQHYISEQDSTSYNGRYFAYLTGSWDRTLKVWDTITKKLVYNNRLEGLGNAYGITLAPPSENGIITFALVHTWGSKVHVIYIHTFNPNEENPKLTEQNTIRSKHQFINLRFAGDHLYVTGLKENFIARWNIRNNAADGIFEATQPIYCSDLCANRSLLAAASVDNAIYIWDAKTTTLLKKIKLGVTCQQLMLSSDGRYLVAIQRGGHGVFAWELIPRNEKISIRLLWSLPRRFDCKGMKLSPKGNPGDDLSKSNRIHLLQKGALEV